MTRIPRAARASGRAALSFMVAASVPSSLLAQESFLRSLDDALSYQTDDGSFSAQLSGLGTLEGHAFDKNPPGLIFGDESPFVNSRLVLFLDTTVGSVFSSFLQARLDRGIDPRSSDIDVRLDEYTLRAAPPDDERFAVQVGKFATVGGNFIARHDFWENPFISAPLPYENVLTISDDAAPSGPAQLLDRREIPDRKGNWVPILWDPMYTSGAAVFLSNGTVSAAVELKNGSLSSRPSVWTVDVQDFDYPTVTGRVGVRPNPAWDLGLTASQGAYLRESAKSSLPPGSSIGDFQQQLLGADLKYEHGYLTIWSELFFNRFEVPNVGNCDSIAYYVEAKYKLRSDLFGAVRWNQQLFDEIADGMGGEAEWDNDFIRTDLSFGYTLIDNLLGKIQYSYSHQTGPVQQGEHYGAVELVAKF